MKNSSIKWDKLATATDTLVILMGMQNIAQITTRLRDHGRKASTPVAVIRDGTLPSQVCITGTLRNIAGKVRQAGLEAPAVIVKILTHLGLPARAPPRSPARPLDLFHAA